MKLAPEQGLEQTNLRGEFKGVIIPDRHNIFFESRIEARIVALTTRVDEVGVANIEYHERTRFLLKEFRIVRGDVIKQDERITTMWQNLSAATERVNELNRENEKIVFTVKAVARRNAKMEKLLNKRMDCIEDKIRDIADLFEKLSIHDN